MPREDKSPRPIAGFVIAILCLLVFAATTFTYVLFKIGDEAQEAKYNTCLVAQRNRDFIFTVINSAIERSGYADNPDAKKYVNDLKKQFPPIKCARP